MEIFNIGILEMLAIFVLAIILLGPEGMINAGRTIGRTIRKIIKSPIWTMFMDTQREIREMPARLVREAGLEEDLKEFQKNNPALRNIPTPLKSDTSIRKAAEAAQIQPASPAAADDAGIQDEPGENTIAPPVIPDRPPAISEIRKEQTEPDEGSSTS